jgi:3-oxoacyl-[acyl-carrier protein] reductase
VDVNLNGVMHLCTLFRKHLENAANQQGSVILIGSTSSFIATPGQPAYGASKGALLTLTKSLARAWASAGIRVNGIAPGFVKTKLTRRSYEDEIVYKETLARIPLGRWGEAEDVADTALFLASSMAAYITGQMVLVDGSLTLM